jgi:hypothetical protein
LIVADSVTYTHHHVHHTATIMDRTITVQMVCTYRGIDRGWQPIGRPRNKQQTERFLQIVKRVRPDYVHSIKPVNVG